ncbi:Putative acyltransferase [Candidatus Hamiltonella defensa (Bemisia tabaci)]|nr:Putative acyltransferase [Candidatus Hamiltonella defensa (Bemisia tabaci)]
MSFLGIASLISSFFISGHYYGNPVFISISILFLSLVLSKPVSLSNKLFIYFGETSYSIYLCHIILMVGISYLVYFLFGVVDINSYTAILIYLISALLIAVILFFSYKYIKYPFLKE